MAWAYHQVSLQQKHLTQASPDGARAAHTSYLQSVHYFLECTNHALTSPLPANDLETVRAYTRDVLTELTHILLKLFAKDRVRTQMTIEPKHLMDVMGKLRCLDDTRVGEYIPDELVPEISDLAEKLTANCNHVESCWVSRFTQRSAHRLKVNIARFKCTRPDTM